MPSLIVTSGILAGQVFSFSGNAVIGRGQFSDVRLNDPTVSRRHAMIRRNGDEFRLWDQDSVNGTLHRGRRIEQAVTLADGDELQFGEIKSQFRNTVDAQPALSTLAVPGDAVTSAASSAHAGLASPKTQSVGLRELLARLKLFCDLGVLARRKQDLREQLQNALDAIQAAFPQTSRAAIYSRVAGTEHLALLARHDRDDAIVAFPQLEDFLYEALRLEHGLTITDAASRTALAARVHADNVPVALLGMPLRMGDDVLGVLYLDSVTDQHAWRAADHELFLGVAGQLAWMIAAQQAQSPERAIELHDLALARRIQQRFLPQAPPTIAGYRIADSYAAARVIGGDYYDFFEYQNGRQGMVIADVSGKSVSGALYMARLSVQVRALARHLAGPAELLLGLNRKLYQELEPGMFVTMLAAALEPDSGLLHLANAGHPAPLLRAPDGSVRDIGEHGALPLGAVADTLFQTYQATLAPGSCALFYTDGLDEAHNAQKELFGKPRIVQTLADNGGNAQATLDALLAEVARFTLGEQQSDDLTLITLGRDFKRR